jgi:Copine
VGQLLVCTATLQSDDGSPVDMPPSEQAPVIEIVDLAKLAPLAAPRVTPMRIFSSYIERGCQIDFCVAIDFTSSNGDPTNESSYHHLGENSMNDYEETISAIGQSLARYSESEEYAVWGFGAKFEGVVRHIFQCGPTATVTGVDGILNAYRSVFESDLTMSGPTVFLQILKAAAARAKRNHDGIREKPRYTVLLVITDGIMVNFEETRQRLDAYSVVPLSVVFVGVGQSDFKLMYQLCTPAASTRCNRTFVEFHRHQHDPAALGEAALRNIPTQLCEYMQTQGI